MKNIPVKLAALAVLCVIAAAGCAVAPSTRTTDGEPIKVRVMDGVKELTISGPSDTLRIEWVGGGRITVNGSEVSVPAAYAPKGEFIYLNGRPYRGQLTVAGDKDFLMVIDEIPLETYIAGIINNEISSKWPKDAVKAQAVVARTYAAYQMKKRGNAAYHIDASTMGQVYKGAAAEDAAANDAVRATAGEILVYNDAPALTVYHSNAGGMTEDSAAVWGSAYPYLRSVDSPYDEAAPKYSWEFVVTAASFMDALRKGGYRLGEPAAVTLQDVTASGRARSLVISDGQGGAVAMSGEVLRKTLGYENIRSTIFEVARGADAFIFRGRGNGHGVGLSQWGAKGMAAAGYSYKEILRHYYPGAELVKIRP